MDKTLPVQKTDITDESRWNLLSKKVQEIQVGNVFALFRNHKIEPVLIKGWAAAAYYPETKYRHSVDIDLAVSSVDYNRALQLTQSEKARGISIDLHRELRRHDTVDWKDLMDNSRMMAVADGTEIRILRPEDHLRVLCTHWLLDGGEYKERLWDIYYLLDGRSPDFDWDRCLNSVSKIRRRWIACTIGLAHRYLGLNVDDTPIADEIRDIPVWFIKTIEREWARDVRILPSEIWFWKPQFWFQQIRKRFPPNPIHATIAMEGSFDARTRIHYQIGNIFQRIVSSYRRISETRKLRSK